MPTDPPVGALVALLRWSSAALVAAVLTGFAFLLVTGRYTEEGPVVLAVTAEHGLHRGDVFVLAGWAVSLLALLVAAALPARRRTPREPGPAAGARVAR
ncbi:hypothetical protein [Modestobacter sp. SYSU DS0290]